MRKELKRRIERFNKENKEAVKKAVTLLEQKGYEVMYSFYEPVPEIVFKELFGAKEPESWAGFERPDSVSIKIIPDGSSCMEESYSLYSLSYRQESIREAFKELFDWIENLPKIERRKFFGFALADSMFAEAGDCTITRRSITVDEVREMAGDFIPCLNPSHKPTIEAAKQRYGLEVEIPSVPPRVSLKRGDSVVVMGVRGLPRLTDRHEYTEEEIAQATFDFSVYTVE